MKNREEQTEFEKRKRGRPRKHRELSERPKVDVDHPLSKLRDDLSRRVRLYEGKCREYHAAYSAWVMIFGAPPNKRIKGQLESSLGFLYDARRELEKVQAGVDDAAGDDLMEREIYSALMLKFSTPGWGPDKCFHIMPAWVREREKSKWAYKQRKKRRVNFDRDAVLESLGVVSIADVSQAMRTLHEIITSWRMNVSLLDDEISVVAAVRERWRLRRERDVYVRDLAALMMPVGHGAMLVNVGRPKNN